VGKRKKKTAGESIIQGLEDVLEHLETGKPFPRETQFFKVGNSRIIVTKENGRTMKVERVPEDKWQKQIKAIKEEQEHL